MEKYNKKIIENSQNAIDKFEIYDILAIEHKNMQWFVKITYSN